MILQAFTPPPITAASIIALYLRHIEITGHCCPESLKERQRTLNRFADALGNLAIEDCCPYHLSDWIEANSDWKSSSTRKAKANQVNAVFNWAVRGKRIPVNPFHGVNYEEAEPRPPMADKALDTLLTKANKRYETAVRFLRLTGCRLSELCQLTWAEVHFDRGIIVLAKHKSRKKTRKLRIFALVPEAVAILQAIRKDQTAEHSGPLFLNNRGKPWNRGTLGQQLRRMKGRGEIQTPATLHGLRHAVGTEAVRNGASLKAVSLQLGHSTTTITEKYYVALDGDADFMREAANSALPKTIHRGPPDCQRVANDSGNAG